MPTRKKAQDSLEAQGFPPAPDHAAMLAAQHEKAGLPTPEAMLVEVYTRDIERIMLGVNDMMDKQTKETGKHAGHDLKIGELEQQITSLEQKLTALEARVNGLASSDHGH